MHESLQEFIDVNLSARVFCTCRANGVSDSKRIRFFEQAVRFALQSELGDSQSIPELERALTRHCAQLGLALAALRPVASGMGDIAPGLLRAAKFVEPDAPKPKQETPAGDRRPAYVPEARSLERKLQDERRPIQSLLTQECVDMGLVSARRAEVLGLRMTGRTREESEAEVVQELREALLKQLGEYLRRRKKHPWNRPADQAQLRKEIAAIDSVRALVAKAEEMRDARLEWDKTHRKPGLLQGLFGG